MITSSFKKFVLITSFLLPPPRVYSRLRNELKLAYSALRPLRVNAVVFACFVMMQYLQYFDDG
ncbi:hypothetical protein BED41_14180 [Cloacibacillus porcorum]|uniref:Uncharacterized protein n=1 Tax=Cloacibacillus porcorum TaxID=1197717 RepID=A0A1B2I834_9BACT|nr:hypothetical protein BED41_14180 [Cloacibacillus porcorum]